MNLIVDAILGGVYFLAAATTNFLYFLPDASLPQGMSVAMDRFGMILAPMSYVIPLDVLSQCIFFLSSVWLAIGLFKFVKWGISLIPFIG